MYICALALFYDTYTITPTFILNLDFQEIERICVIYDSFEIFSGIPSHSSSPGYKGLLDDPNHKTPSCVKSLIIVTRYQKSSSSLHL